MEAVVFENYTFAYASKAPAVQNVSWQIEEGAFAVLAGNTGSGKTTLLRSLHPLLSPAGKSAGTIRLYGQEPSSVDSAHVAALVGYVGQHPSDQIVCDSVWHELAFGLENMGIESSEMRRHVAEVAHYFGIEPWLHEPTAELSGGQMQLLNLAAVLVCRPRILLLDEPTAQLDPVAASNFIDALVRVNREIGTTVIVATHDAYTFQPFATCSYFLGQQAPIAYPDFQNSDTFSVQPAKSFISLKEVFFRYERNLAWVLRGINLDVEKGSIHALVGGNGSGKSSVLSLISGVKKPLRGKVYNESQRQAFLPQDPKMLMVCDTVAEELSEWEYASPYSEAERNVIVAQFGLEGVLDQHPFDTSGGQQQKIALAKILLTKPDLLLLDEPTKGLDAPTRRQLAYMLYQAKQGGTTVVLASHDLAFVEALSDKVTMLFDGQDAQTTSPEDFFAGNLFLRPSLEARQALGLKGFLSGAVLEGGAEG